MVSYEKDKDKLQARLKRIEGQVRGLQRMVGEDKYCVDILTQTASIRAALQQVELMLLEDHLGHCVTNAIKEGDGDEKIVEIMEVVRRYTKA